MRGSLYEAIQPVTRSGYKSWNRLGFVEEIGRMHLGQGNFCFLDLHVEPVRWQLGPAGQEWLWYKYAFRWLPDGVPDYLGDG